MPIKRRVISSSFETRSLTYAVPGSGDKGITPVATSGQVVTSNGHAYQLLGRSKGNIGGGFSSQKLEISLDSGKDPEWIRTIDGRGQYSREYFVVPVPSADVRTLSSILINNQSDASKFDAQINLNVGLGFSNLELTALGAKAVDQMAPLNPVAEVSTTLAEFFSERKFFNVPGNAGSAPGEYLNYQFGIAPTVGFAQDLRKAIRDKEKIVSQLARDSGRTIRRRGPVFSDSSSTETLTSGVYPAYFGVGPSTQVNTTGTLSKTTTTSRKAWFSGAFTYYLPKEGVMRTIAELDAKYGVKPGADTAWELLPFSWLADYKLSAGAAISNFSRFTSDGLVMKYGYIMGETTQTTRYAWSGYICNASGSLSRRDLAATVVRTTKRRMLANPFGFGILPGDLSDRQLSIIAALGLTYLK